MVDPRAALALLPLLAACAGSHAAAPPAAPALAEGRRIDFLADRRPGGWNIPAAQAGAWRTDAHGMHCAGGTPGDGPAHRVVNGIVHLHLAWRSSSADLPFRIEGFGPTPPAPMTVDGWNSAHLAFEDGRATLTVNGEPLYRARYIHSEFVPPERRLVLLNTGAPCTFGRILQVDR